jgi:glycosyltransferase involved in cell wall biosynthesis
MKIVIATPLYPPEIGGPATYAKLLFEGLSNNGYIVVLVQFANVRRYPTLLRHFVYFWRVFSALRGADSVIAFDSWSTGIPAFLAAQLRGKKMIVRIGGDFLWETYVQRTHALIKLSEFYEKKRSFSFKEHLIKIGTKWMMYRVDAVIFNTKWQRDIWGKEYKFNLSKTFVIENEYPVEREISPTKGRIFVAAGRTNFLKNIEMLGTIFDDLKHTFPDIELDARILPSDAHRARIRDSYAVIIPSVSEISPNSAVDAIRYGKPFIMPYDTGVRERLTGASIFVDTLNTEALKIAVQKLLDIEEYNNACTRVRAFNFVHSQKEILEEFILILNKICAS